MADLNQLAADLDAAAVASRSAREAVWDAEEQTVAPLKEAAKEAGTAERRAREVFDRAVQDVRGTTRR